jgi:hypothetical protein
MMAHADGEDEFERYTYTYYVSALRPVEVLEKVSAKHEVNALKEIQI